jgi:hypothetical protein
VPDPSISFRVILHQIASQQVRVRPAESLRSMDHSGSQRLQGVHASERRRGICGQMRVSEL